MYNPYLLNAALGYPTQPPPAPITRSIRMLFKDRASIEPYVEKTKFIPKKFKEENSKFTANYSQKTILKLVNKGKPVTAASASLITKWGRNHCSLILTRLHKEGLVRRYKDKGNGTRWYVYVALENTDDKS